MTRRDAARYPFAKAHPSGAATLDPPRVTAPDAPRKGALTEAWPQRSQRTRRRVPRPVRRLAGPLLLVAAWQLLNTWGVVDARSLAPPADVVRAGWELWQAGELQEHLLVSLRRAVYGLTIGVSVGVAVATLAGLFRRGDELIDPAVQILRAVPVLGLLPLVIIWFGIGEAPKIALVAIGTAFSIYINTFAGIRNVDAKLVETATTFGATRWGLVRHVVLPGAVPGFLVGLRFALTGAWLIMIDDSRRMAAALADCELVEWPELVHVFPHVAPHAPESIECLTAIGDFARRVTRQAQVSVRA